MTTSKNKAKKDLLDIKYSPQYPIRSAAKMLGISIPTLRMYEKEGLIIPFQKDTKHRLYSDADIERLQCIRAAINEKKISIAGIKSLLSMIPCWKIIGCSAKNQAECQALQSAGEPCWAFEHRKNACSTKECRTCIVYQQHTTCESIKLQIIESMRQ